MRKRFVGSYEEIISLANFFAAREEFVSGKRNKKDVRVFSLSLADSIVRLHEELANFSYAHGSYQSFFISDPKPRHIHKAVVRDRVLRTKTKRRMFRKIGLKIRRYKVGEISRKSLWQTPQSYLGMLNHCRGRQIDIAVKRLLED